MQYAVFTLPSFKSFELEWLACLGSQEVQGILRTVWTPVGNTGHPSFNGGILMSMIMLFANDNLSFLFPPHATLSTGVLLLSR